MKWPCCKGAFRFCLYFPFYFVHSIYIFQCPCSFFDSVSFCICRCKYIWVCNNIIPLFFVCLFTRFFSLIFCLFVWVLFLSFSYVFWVCCSFFCNLFVSSYLCFVVRWWCWLLLCYSIFHQSPKLFSFRSVSRYLIFDGLLHFAWFLAWLHLLCKRSVCNIGHVSFIQRITKRLI